MAAQVDLLPLETFPSHVCPLDVLVSRHQLPSLFRDDTETPTVLFTPLRPLPRSSAVLLRVRALGDEESASVEGATVVPPPTGRVRLFASGLFLRLRGFPAAGARGTARPVAPVDLHRVVLGVRGGASPEREDADGFAAQLLELCRAGRLLLARRGEPLGAQFTGQMADALVLSCDPVTQGRITADTAVVLSDGGDETPPPRKLQLCASDFARVAAAGSVGDRSFLDRPEETERRLDIRVADVWRHDRDVDAGVYVGRRALLRLGLFDGEWVKVRAAGRARSWRAATVAALPSDDDDAVVSAILWFNLTGGEETAAATCRLRVKRWRRVGNDDVAASSASSSRSASPPWAGELHLRPVASPWRGVPDAVLAAHFSVPRLVAPGDVLRVSARNHPDLMEDTSRGCRALFFVVERACLPDQTEETDAFYLADRRHTSLFMGAHVNNSVPFDGSELPLCPERTVDAIEHVLRPHTRCGDGGSLSACRLLVYGPAGSGKTMAVVAASFRLHLRLIKVDCVDVRGDTPAATEARLASAFERADAAQPCLVLLRNLQLLLRSRGGAEDDARVRAALCRVVRGAPDGVAVAATVRKPRQLPPDVAAAFVHQVAVENVDEERRRDILKRLCRDLRLDRDVDTEKLAQVTAGFVLGDLRALLVEAGRAACKRLVLACPGRLEADVCAGGVTVRQRDFLSALQTFQDVQSEAVGAPKIPAVSWEDVGGLELAKKDILDTLQLPLRHPQLSSLKLNRTGILLYGPPGTGKTLLAKAVATECAMTFLSVKGPELLNMYVGQSEENIREVFQKARSAAPCVVFFDELDSLAPGRGRGGDSGGVMDRVVSQMLAELDALDASAGVFVLGATNRPDLLDPSLLRPGRFDKLVYIGIDPDPNSRLKVLRAVLRNFHLDDAVDLAQVSERCPARVTGADLYALCSDAATVAVKRKIRDIERGLDTEDSPPRLTMDDFEAALRDFRPSLSEEEAARYRRLQRSV
ncbi:peroxisomal ATPase PEX6 [Corythoichthys intestinalis]|uniref:peroxisomal ATPase PEX6 n=1 Tax=Corythoichthys intestinalis TaxID=161448 RepID=UPI0025A51D5F|nr:peroxisomal ATPase PEX6 [Corythoichthys intestinalis]